LIVANPNNLRNNCGGALTAPPGATSILLVNGSLAANASCTISLDLQVTATRGGSLTSPTVILSSNQAPNAIAEAINLTVTMPDPTFTMTIEPSRTSIQTSSRATGNVVLTITNNASVQLRDLEFRLELPLVPGNGLDIPQNPNVRITRCGNLTFSSNQRNVNNNIPASLDFTQGSVAPGETCTVQVSVQTDQISNTGEYTYTILPVRLRSANAATVTAGPASWKVTVQ
jgi:hypothetical protein